MPTPGPVPRSPAATASRGLSGSGVGPGVVIGGVVLLGVGAAGAVTIGRRRAFYRADREGRVVLVGPPSLSAAALAARLGIPGGAVGTGERERHGIVVKLLGWLEIEGTKQPVTAGPLLELICYLALNPGRSFTSVQIRESIWGLGRQPITSGTFRNYMVALRKAFGPGVVVTDRYRYELTDAVTSDWDLFRGRTRGRRSPGGLESRHSAWSADPSSTALSTGRRTRRSRGPSASPTTSRTGSPPLRPTSPTRASTSATPDGPAGPSHRASSAPTSNVALRRMDLEVGAADGRTKELGTPARGRSGGDGAPSPATSTSSKPSPGPWAGRPVPRAERVIWRGRCHRPPHCAAGCHLNCHLSPDKPVTWTFATAATRVADSGVTPVAVPSRRCRVKCRCGSHRTTVVSWSPASLVPWRWLSSLELTLPT